MALIGSLATIRTQLAGNPSFQRTLDYVEEVLRPGSAANQRVFAVPAGDTQTVDLGDGVFAMEQAYQTKAPADGRWESHRAYIDVQVIVSGEELMGVVDVSQLSVAEDLTPEKDVIFFNAYEDASVLRVRAGEVAVFYPVDAHKPCVTAGAASVQVHKTVVKVPVSAVA